jgi:hypothetical protein
VTVVLVVDRPGVGAPLLDWTAACRGQRERVALFLSLIAGFHLMHHVLGSATPARTDRAAPTRRLEALFQTLVD